MVSFLKKFKRIEISIAIALVISIIFSITGFAWKCGEVRNDVLRLHIIANSDSAGDQALKLKVRDAILIEGNKIFDGSLNVENAEAKLLPVSDKLKEAAEKVIHENGYNYNVDIKVGREYFNTREYEKFTMPAGQYMAVRVLIGSAQGHNWWCVLFPPLCIPAAQGETSIDAFLKKDEVQLVESNPKYEPRFKIVEIIEKLREEWR